MRPCPGSPSLHSAYDLSVLSTLLALPPHHNDKCLNSVRGTKTSENKRLSLCPMPYIECLQKLIIEYMKAKTRTEVSMDQAPGEMLYVGYLI